MSKVKKQKENFSDKKKPFDEFVWHSLLAFWIAGIFILSSFEGSGEHYWNTWVFVQRKSAHIFEFFILAYLVWKVLLFYPLKARERFWLTLLLSLFGASWDEVHQLFVFGREGKIEDMVIDLVGIVLFLLVVFFLEKKKPLKRK